MKHQISYSKCISVVTKISLDKSLQLRLQLKLRNNKIMRTPPYGTGQYRSTAVVRGQLGAHPLGIILAVAVMNVTLGHLSTQILLILVHSLMIGQLRCLNIFYGQNPRTECHYINSCNQYKLQTKGFYFTKNHN